MYKILDLFAGAGGMSLGFTQTGKFISTVSFEKDKFARETYKQNHLGATVLGDVSEIKDYGLFNEQYGPFDVIVGGPPCQGFSNANRQKNYLISKNNALVKKYVEFIVNLRPKAFIMENVKMLTSDIHRFYYSSFDMYDVSSLGIGLRVDRICLIDGIYPSDLKKWINVDSGILNQMIIPQPIFNKLKLLFKSSYTESKRNMVLNKLGKSIVRFISNYIEKPTSSPQCYRDFEKTSLTCFLNYIDGHSSLEDMEPSMREFMSVQRMLTSVRDLLENHIIVDTWHFEKKGVYAEIRSYSVLEYMVKKLSTLYVIDDGVLNAAWYGVPQTRERYIAMGIRKDLADLFEINPKLPSHILNSDQYRTVSDGIRDLENVNPVYNTDDLAVHVSSVIDTSSVLLDSLRDTDTLCNHITTSSRDTALKRFAALRQGQNFHDLDLSLIEDTYTQPERTQNSIYLRLEYNKPSGTVTNVRKSMWIHPVLNRAISIREAARLQSFPDSFRFYGTKDSQYQQVGNAVPPMMAKAIAEALCEILDCCVLVGNELNLARLEIGEERVLDISPV